jgi:hypothetical protein
MLEIASTYNKVIKNNHKILEDKNDDLGIALFILKSFLVTTLLHIFIKEVIYFVTR